MAGDGVRNPTDMTPVLDGLDDIETSIGEILDEFDNIDAALVTLEDHILIALGDVADTIDAVLVDTQLLIGRLTELRAGYLDELSPTNLPSDVDDLLYDTAVIAHKDEARTRVYPRDTRVTQTLICGGAADTFGNWAEVVPIDTIDFTYKVIGVVVEETDAASTYLIQLGYSTDAGTDPTTAQIMGERRIKLLGAPIKMEKEILEILGCHAPANAKLWGRVKSASGAADELEVSVVVTRHIGITNEIEHLATWPWAS